MCSSDLIAHPAFGVGMQIAAADTGGINPHLDFARAWVFDRFFRQLKFAWRNQFGYKHVEVPTAIVR